MAKIKILVDKNVNIDSAPMREGERIPLSSSNKKQGLDHILKVQAMRAMTLIANFNMIDDAQSEGLDEILVTQLPLAEFPQIPETIVAQYFDPGRSNSCITSSKRCAASFFQDTYQRDAHFQRLNNVSLTKASCVLPTKDPLFKYIPVVFHLLPIVHRYLTEKSKGEALYKIMVADIPFPHLGRTKRTYLIKIPNELVPDTLLHLGHLGALPNRDRQLRLLTICIDSPEEMRDYYFLHMSTAYQDFPQKFEDVKEYVHIKPSFEERKAAILTQLETQQEAYPSGPKPEQRLLYSQLLAKLISATHLLEDKSHDRQYRLQSSLALERIETMLQHLEGTSYSSFLRTLEACVDEYLILLTLQYHQNPMSALQISSIVKQFIVDTVGIPPQMATLRTSAMQAIWSSMQMALDFFEVEQREQPLNVYAPQTIYFEIVNILQTLFNAPTYELEKSLSIALNSDYSSQAIESASNVIYDLYITNFESNFQLREDHIQFSDINDFVENQFRLRKEKSSTIDRPLVLLLDNTMSDFDEVYLPVFLMQFEAEITEGKLCVLISHSGNKYIHLGTDKVLAAMLYGYYNRDVFFKMDAFIHQELNSNMLGDFDPNSPTVLLTQAFMQHGKEEILSFAPFIRQRTLHLFKNTVPEELVNSPGYFTIDNPLSDATYKELPGDCKTMQNCCGFITIKCYVKGDFHKKILGDLCSLLTSMGIIDREGFGFSQTTLTKILASDLPCAIRISVGTEALDSIELVIQLVCDYLLEINAIMEKYRCNPGSESEISSQIANLPSEYLYDEITAAHQHALTRYSMIEAHGSPLTDFPGLDREILQSEKSHAPHSQASGSQEGLDERAVTIKEEIVPPVQNTTPKKAEENASQPLSQHGTFKSRPSSKQTEVSEAQRSNCCVLL